MSDNHQAVAAYLLDPRLPECVREHHFRQAELFPASHFFQNEPSIRTIGLPLYKAKNAQAYHAAADATRSLIRQRLGRLHAFVIDALSEATGERAFVTDRFAPPGCHLISGSSGKPFWGGTWHRDGFAHRVPEIADVHISGTLLLSEEQQCHSLHFKGDGSDTELRFFHEPGRITLFDGARSHRIGALSVQPDNQPPSDEWSVLRVTLQFHGLQGPGGIELFW